jgi:radical SAM protein with 4Fe4S-binding SPASM domain
MYCYGDCGRASARPELSTQEWLDFINELVADDIISVFFEGGEPLLRPDMMQLLAACTPHMMTWLRTNGTLVSADVAAELKRIGVGTVLVDMGGATAATHERVMGVPGSYERSIAGIRHLVAAGLPTIMLIILNRHNVGELQDFVKLAEGLGVPKVGILRLYPLGRARRRWSELACSLEEMTAALGALQAPPGVHVMQSWHPKDGNCCWQNAAVMPFGDSVGCPYLRDFVNYGNIRETRFLDTWNHPLYRRLREGPPSSAAHCSECSSNESTRGGCRSTAYAFHGDWDAPDPFCSTLNHGVDLRALPK